MYCSFALAGHRGTCLRPLHIFALLCFCFKQVSYADRTVHQDIGSFDFDSHADLVCYRIYFNVVDINFDDFFTFSAVTNTCGLKYKLYKLHSRCNTRRYFFYWACCECLDLAATKCKLFVAIHVQEDYLWGRFFRNFSFLILICYLHLSTVYFSFFTVFIVLRAAVRIPVRHSRGPPFPGSA